VQLIDSAMLSKMGCGSFRFSKTKIEGQILNRKQTAAKLQLLEMAKPRCLLTCSPGTTIAVIDYLRLLAWPWPNVKHGPPDCICDFLLLEPRQDGASLFFKGSHVHSSGTPFAAPRLGQ
jgi:hypothetical protein